MIWTILLIGFTGLNPIRSWDVSLNNQFDLLESWGITRVARGSPDRIRAKFPEHMLQVCDTMHITDDSPFVAIVLFKTSGRFLCMGSIIDSRHVLSAKRCYDRTDDSDLLIVAGYFKPWWGRRAQVRKVKRILRHEYAVALLRLTKSLKLTPHVKPIRLPSSITKSQMEFEETYPPPYKVAGIPVDRFDVPGDYISKVKLYRIVEDNFLPFEECKKNYSKIVLEPSKLFCSIGNATYCWGAWGAPVMKLMTDDYYLQVGVVIADNCTADITGPLLNARTDVFGDWIYGNSYQGHQPT